jgi:hypothetical protein
MSPGAHTVATHAHAAMINDTRHLRPGTAVLLIVCAIVIVSRQVGPIVWQAGIRESRGMVVRHGIVQHHFNAGTVRVGEVVFAACLAVAVRWRVSQVPKGQHARRGRVLVVISLHTARLASNFNSNASQSPQGHLNKTATQLPLDGFLRLPLLGKLLDHH